MKIRLLRAGLIALAAFATMQGASGALESDASIKLSIRLPSLCLAGLVLVRLALAVLCNLVVYVAG